MAKGKLTGGRPFPKGVSGNPKGRPPVPEDIREARKVNQFEFERIVNRLFYMSARELTRLLKDPETPRLERMLGKLVQAACWSGDYRRIEALISRSVGKVDTRVQVGQVEKPNNERNTEEMSDEELDQRAQELARKITRAK